MLREVPREVAAHPRVVRLEELAQAPRGRGRTARPDEGVDLPAATAAVLVVPEVDVVVALDLLDTEAKADLPPPELPLLKGN